MWLARQSCVIGYRPDWIWIWKNKENETLDIFQTSSGRANWDKVSLPFIYITVEDPNSLLPICGRQAVGFVAKGWFKGYYTLTKINMFCAVSQITNTWSFKKWKKYTSSPRYWNIPVLVNTGTFLVFQYCLKMWYLHSSECACVIQKFTILEHKNGLVLSNTRVPVSGTWSILFPKK